MGRSLRPTRYLLIQPFADINSTLFSEKMLIDLDQWGKVVGIEILGQMTDTEVLYHVLRKYKLTEFETLEEKQ